jgi:hypothetical protein
MTLTWITGIPASGDNPSTDQPNMLLNNDVVPTYVAVDHVAFGTAGSGQHNQVTFPYTNPPSVPTSPPILFTDTVAGLPQLKFFSGDAAHSSSQYVVNANGSTFLLGGIIMKWGNGSGNSPGNPITFSSAFPNNCWAVICQSTNTSYTGSFIASSVGVSSFVCTRTSGSGNTGMYYIAIGN